MVFAKLVLILANRMLKLGKLVSGNHQKARDLGHVFFISCRKISKTDFLPYCNRILRNFVSTKKTWKNQRNFHFLSFISLCHFLFSFCHNFSIITSKLRWFLSTSLVIRRGGLQIRKKWNLHKVKINGFFKKIVSYFIHLTVIL